MTDSNEFRDALAVTLGNAWFDGPAASDEPEPWKRVADTFLSRMAAKGWFPQKMPASPPVIPDSSPRVNPLLVSELRLSPSKNLFRGDARMGDFPKVLSEEERKRRDDLERRYPTGSTLVAVSDGAFELHNPNALHAGPCIGNPCHTCAWYRGESAHGTPAQHNSVAPSTECGKKDE